MEFSQKLPDRRRDVLLEVQLGHPGSTFPTSLRTARGIEPFLESLVTILQSGVPGKQMYIPRVAHNRRGRVVIVDIVEDMPWTMNLEEMQHTHCEMRWQDYLENNLRV